MSKGFSRTAKYAKLVQILGNILESWKILKKYFLHKNTKDK